MDLRTIQSGGGGLLGAVARMGLSALSVPFAAAAHTRAWLYDRGWLAAHRCGRPVVAVGNLTAGGTGKTPFVAWLVAATRAVGRRPGILARGYGPRPAGSPLSDEGTLLAELVGRDVPQVEDPVRVRGAGKLLADHPDVDLVVLDDGFQHRALARDVDVVLVDATAPFGGGRFLPRGLLRESPRALGRADVVVVTRADAVTPDALASLRARVAALAPRADVALARTRATGLVDADGARHPLTALSGVPVAAWSGIGNPAAFEHTLEAAGARVVVRRRAPDHHRPTRAALVAVSGDAARAGAALVVVTRKDLVKVRALGPAGAGSGAPRLWALDVETDVHEGREALLRRVAAAGRTPR
ncbi:MAG: tetraacyldisaccharide 4'-kinase [Planctomycetia bacterium]|nr:tetraacyldisaccharide 4'-kinase [Planctomycetia bacterium]